MKHEVYDALFEHEQTHWWYRVRRLMVHSFVSRTIGHKKNSTLLDVGCGTGELMQGLQQYVSVQGIDMSSEAVNYCKSRGVKNVLQGDLQALPFNNDSFDIVLALDVLEHLEHDVEGAREIVRVLKKGGSALFFVPALDALWGSTDDVSQHYRRYTKSQLKKVMQSAGIQVTRITYFNTLLFLPILIVRITARLLGRDVVDEYRPGSGTLNQLLFYMFLFETRLLWYVNFPIGVSLMVECRK